MIDDITPVLLSDILLPFQSLSTNLSLIYSILNHLRSMGITVLYGRGLVRRFKPKELPISHTKDFDGYLSVLDKDTKKYDVLINDGRCKPQVAYRMRSHLKENGLMIVRGGNIPTKGYYSIMESYYTLEKK